DGVGWGSGAQGKVAGKREVEEAQKAVSITIDDDLHIDEEEEYRKNENFGKDLHQTPPRNIKDKILVPKPPKNCARCAKCGHPVNGHYCQGCALLRERLEEDLVSYLKYFHDASESSDDSTNVVNAHREPFVVKQDHGVKSSQNPPPIDKCFSECGDALEGIFGQQCICKSCGKGAHIGYNCPPKLPIISNPESCNQTMNDELP
nr:hypothetical protein CTI12_AA557360 [Tanacetum cinerariifolium]